MNLIVYIIIVLCLFTMGIRSLFFSDKELKEEYFEDIKKFKMVCKHYKLWGKITIVVSAILFAFLFIPF